MAGYKGHIIGASLLYIGILVAIKECCVPSLTCSVEWLCAILAGALFPDIDIKSKGQRYFYWIMLALFLWLIVQQRFDVIALLSIIIFTPLLVPHRGLFHQTWFVTFFPCVVWMGMCIVIPTHSRTLFFSTCFFICGALSHLFIDFVWIPVMRSLGIVKKPVR